LSINQITPPDTRQRETSERGFIEDPQARDSESGVPLKIFDKTFLLLLSPVSQLDVPWHQRSGLKGRPPLNESYSTVTWSVHRLSGLCFLLDPEAAPLTFRSYQSLGSEFAIRSAFSCTTAASSLLLPFLRERAPLQARWATAAVTFEHKSCWLHFETPNGSSSTRPRSHSPIFNGADPSLPAPSRRLRGGRVGHLRAREMVIEGFRTNKVGCEATSKRANRDALAGLGRRPGQKRCRLSLQR